MREQTKVIKEILKTKYPISKFKLKYVETNNYIDGSDKIVVTCDRDIDVDDVILLIKNNIRGIAVFKTGDVGIIHENYNQFNEPQIQLLDGTWLDADVMEFIEICNSKLSFELMRKIAKSKR